MGAVAPVNLINRKQAKIIEDQVVKPALEGLAAKGSEFVGCLYPGLMTKDGDVNVVEFNARFGDPEAEVYMRLLDSDLYEILYSCVQGNLRALKWKKGYAVSVVLASAGYPASSRQGDIISGIEDAEKLKDIVVFHAGTKKVNNHFVTASGRVLNVTATGRTLDEALAKAYAAAETISFVGMHYRTDIGKRPH